ncbi:uncharacterized protein LOC135461940 isoform X2 [Liolophura sinensis]|uniref:uncharacterized protein LOC135461940 isoform X2 n=1 Tax=Liolophura sinensis TaxID=3198878 RepID=UPI00315952E9
MIRRSYEDFLVPGLWNLVHANHHMDGILGTPRDLTRYDPAIDDVAELRLSGDFRLKGWPERDFLEFRNPVRRTKEELSQEKTRLAGYCVYQFQELPKPKPPAPPTEEDKTQSPEENADIKPSDSKTSSQSSGSDTPNNTRPASSQQRVLGGQDVPILASSQPRVSGAPENLHLTSSYPKVSVAQTGHPTASLTSLSGRFIRDPYKEKTPSELAKLHQQMFEADQDILRYKQERIQKLKEETEAKKRDLEMLQSYDPFGKPGGGAPQNAVKKTKFLEEDLTPREQPRYRRPVEPEAIGDFFADNFGRPGGGAPLKTDSGNIKTSIRGDPTIRFQKTENVRQAIENHIRYHKPVNETQQYNHALDKQIEQKKLDQQLQKLEDLKKEIDMLKHNPYGKPGAGAPNRTISDLDAASPGVHQKRLEGSEDYDPWGKGAVQPTRLEDGSIVRHKNYLSNKYATQIREDDVQGTSLDFRPRGGGGAPHLNENGQVVTRLPVTMNANDYGQNVIKEEVAGVSGKQTKEAGNTQAYFPFGRPGAGAPRRDEEGRILTTLARKLTRESSSANDIRKARAAQLYHRDLAKGVEEQKRNKQEMENYLKAPVGELASVLREGQVGKPRRDPVTGMLLPHHLHTSDVTQLKINDINYRAATDSKNYHHDLTKAAEERYRSRELEKLKERQEAKHHEQVFSHFWGRPGAGAPTGNLRKLNLDDTLFSKKQNMHTGDWDYVKNSQPGHLTSRSLGHLDNVEFERYMNNHSRGPIGDSDGHQKYIRSTIHSTHANQYDLDANQKRGQRIDYKVDAPWAAM